MCGTESIVLVQPNEICLGKPEGLPADVFWIEPGSLGTVRDMINNAHLSTMVLGVETRRDELVDTRKKVADALLDNEDPLVSEQLRALEVGFLYGTLLAGDDESSTSKKSATELPEGYIEGLSSAKDALDLEIENDSYLFFMRLRDLEVEFAGSDILAFCLAATQDHMSHMFWANSQGENKPTGKEITILQSLYYAGVLSGALVASNRDLPYERAEIMRSRRHTKEPVSLRLEFEQGDNLEDQVINQLASKNSFHVITDEKGNKQIVFVPGGLQFGPNAISLPFYLYGLSENPTTAFLDIERVDGLIVKDAKQGTAEEPVIRVVTKEEVERTAEESTDQDSDLNIVGVIAGGRLVSSYDANHPHWQPILNLVQRVMGGKEFDVLGDNQFWSELYQTAEAGSPRKRRLVFGAALLGCWVPDGLAKILTPNHEVKWGQSLLTMVGVVAIFGLDKAAKHIRQRGDRTVARFDDALQQHMDNITLPQPKNSGNIPS